MPLIRCLDCGRDVSDRAPACPNCGAPVVSAAPGGAAEPSSTASAPAVPRQSPHTDTRAGVNQAQLSEQGSTLLFGQITIIAVVAGFATQSWWIGGGAFFALLMLLSTPKLRTPLAIALALGVGVAGYAGAQLFELDSGATWVIAIVAGLIALGGNLAGIDWLKDIQDRDH